MKKIFFVRHGFSLSNANGTISGSEDDTDLDDTGRKQAAVAGEDLKGRKIELIVSSPMKRTVETAQIIADVTGYSREKIVVNKLFVERAYGVYSGRPENEYWDDDKDNKVHPSVETTQAMYERFSRALDWLRNRKKTTLW